MTCEPIKKKLRKIDENNKEYLDRLNTIIKEINDL